LAKAKKMAFSFIRQLKLTAIKKTAFAIITGIAEACLLFFGEGQHLLYIASS
jgi:hypothetical protein